MSQKTVKVVAHLTAKDDKVKALEEVLTAAIPSTRKEEGCISYELFQNTSNPSDFTFVEEWRDNSCLEGHLASPDFAKMAESLNGLLAAAPDIRVYRLVM